MAVQLGEWQARVLSDSIDYSAISSTNLDDVYANSVDLDEQATRSLIDQQLRDRGWEADSVLLKQSKGVVPEKGRNLAIAEWQTESGPADYALFVGEFCIGIVEAKRNKISVSAAIDQAERYSRSLDWPNNSDVWDDEYRVPFVFATNGRPYLKQIETESGIWFRDTRHTTNRRRALNGWFRPEDLTSMLKLDRGSAERALRGQSLDRAYQLRSYQRKAIEVTEKALADGKREVLIAMATGTGKTRTSLEMLYRFLHTRRFRSICFVVDRNALGRQAADEFKVTEVDGSNTLSQLFGVMELDKAIPDDDTRIHICTIQGLVKRVLYRTDPADIPSVGQYDLIVVDECHRGYNPDREMTQEEIAFRSYDDYISKYRRILEHFDAVKIGLTATPAFKTIEIFGKPAFTYSYREAVIDGWLADHEPPIRFHTELSTSGIRFEEGETANFIDNRTKDIQTSVVTDQLEFGVEDFNKKVITKPFNQVVAKKLADYIDPHLDEKTIVFAANNSHADLFVEELKSAFEEKYGSIEDGVVKKITAASDHPQKLIRSFRNDIYPNVAVTVDLLTTGVDIPKVANIVFMRRVNSLILYEQMIGRATRLCDEIGKEYFQIFDAVDLYSSLQDVSEMKPVSKNLRQTFESLFAELNLAKSEEAGRLILDQIIAKLNQKVRSMPDKICRDIKNCTGMDVYQICDQFSNSSPAEVNGYIQKVPQLKSILDSNYEIPNSIYTPISTQKDKLTRVTHGYGNHRKPEDFIYAFNLFINSSKNHISALSVVINRPRDLTRSDLRSLYIELDKLGFSEVNLRRAWNETSNKDIAASIIGYIRQAAIGDPLVPFEDRVRIAVQGILSGREWSELQKRWLRRIAAQIVREVVLDRESIDQATFAANGGFNHLNIVFDGHLEDVLRDFNEEVWRIRA